jgi:hypothetical protein
VEIWARRAAVSGLVYWLRSLVGASLGGGATQVEDRDAPAVIVGDESAERVLLQTGTYGQARRAAVRFTEELHQVGEEEFRRRYGLPGRGRG